MQVISSCFIVCADIIGTGRVVSGIFVKNVVVVTLKGCHKQSLIDTVNTGLDSICGTHSSKFSLLHQEDQNLWLKRAFTLPFFVDVVMTFDLKPRLSILLSLDEVSQALQQNT